MGERMLLYAALLTQEYHLPVVPILLLSYDQPCDIREPDRYIINVHGQEYLRLKWHVVQLNRLNWRDFVKRQNPATAVLMAKMGIKPEDRVRVKLEITRVIATLRLNPDKMRVISTFMGTYLQLSDKEEHEYEKLATAENIGEPSMKFYMVGERKGRKEGRMEGMRKAIGEVLESRFRDVPYLVTEKIGYIEQEAKLHKLLRLAVAAKDMDEFTAAL